VRCHAPAPSVLHSHGYCLGLYLLNSKPVPTGSRQSTDMYRSAGSHFFGNQTDTSNDFDLLGGATGCENNSNDLSGVALSGSHAPRLSLSCAYLRSNSGNLSNAQNGDASQDYGLGHNLPRHSLGVHQSSSSSAGMLSSASDSFQNNPFNSGLIHTSRGYPLCGHMHGRSQGLSDAGDGNININMLTCAGVPGMRGDAISMAVEPNPCRNYAMSMPQVPQVHPR
jgi:hypothetical protein